MVRAAKAAAPGCGDPTSQRRDVGHPATRQTLWDGVAHEGSFGGEGVFGVLLQLVAGEGCEGLGEEPFMDEGS